MTQTMHFERPPIFATDKFIQVETFVQKNQNTLRIAGLVTVAAVTGIVGGVLLAKGLFAMKGAAVAGAGLAPSLLQQGSAAGSMVLVDHLTGVVNTLSSVALPLTTGAIVGGVVGVGATRYRVYSTQRQLDEQIAQTRAAQQTAKHLQSAVSTFESNLRAVEAQTVAAPTFSQELVIPDPLEQIRGIGPVAAKKLNAAGIYTFADLARQTPEQLLTALGNPRQSARIQPLAWIEQARQLADYGSQSTPLKVRNTTRRQRSPLAVEASVAPAAIVLERLEVIAGITPEIAARFNRAGILTYADLAAQTPTRLREIVGQAWSGYDQEIATWLTIAQTLATNTHTATHT